MVDIIEESFTRIERKGDYSTNPYLISLRRLIRNPVGIISLAIILVFVVIAILGANIRSDPSPDANTQIPQIQMQKPGFSCWFLLVRKNAPSEKKSFWEKLLFGGENPDYTYIPLSSPKVSFYREKVIVSIYRGYESNEYDSISVIDVLYPLDFTKPVKETGEYVSFYTIDGKFITRRLSEMYNEIKQKNIIKKTFWMGTDIFGRDIFSRIMLGSTVSLSIGIISVIISLILGVGLGAIAGYYGGIIDRIIVFIINVFWAIPSLLLAIAISLVLGKGMWQVLVVLGLTNWPEIARVIRGQALVIKEMDFIKAARATGLSDFRIITFHMIPNLISPVVIFAAYGLATAIILEAGLSFLGIGVQPPTPSWGRMIRDYYSYILTDYAYLAIIPGIFLTILVLAFTMLGYAMRDAFDVKYYHQKQ